jgi:SWIM/SEC-C metal-binding protein
MAPLPVPAFGGSGAPPPTTAEVNSRQSPSKRLHDPYITWLWLFSANNIALSLVNGEKMEKVFDGKKTAKIGTEKKPAVVSVQTEERLQEVATIFEENGWKYTIKLEPDKPEDIIDLERLLNPPKPKIAEKKVGRNEPCPCGSGNKYKKCCGR